MLLCLVPQEIVEHKCSCLSEREKYIHYLNNRDLIKKQKKKYTLSTYYEKNIHIYAVM